MFKSRKPEEENQNKQNETNKHSTTTISKSREETNGENTTAICRDRYPHPLRPTNAQPAHDLSVFKGLCRFRVWTSIPICLSRHADFWLQTHTVELQISSTPLITNGGILSKADQYV